MYWKDLPPLSRQTLPVTNKAENLSIFAFNSSDLNAEIKRKINKYDSKITTLLAVNYQHLVIEAAKEYIDEIH
jgi:hypothetical protein